ncbi:MAG TPA: hypothetical protein VFQ45_23455 [Longimicrobium sp.]|nr:hypothetical protein [Longimicrobium sp.]
MTHRVLPLTALCAAALLASTPAHAQRRADPARPESMLQVTCNGTMPDATLHARSAQGALNRALVAQGDGKRFYYEQALGHVRDGLFEDSANPRYHLAAGEAHLGLGQLDEGGKALSRAVELCPELADIVEPLRQNAWATLFQQGMDAYTAGDTAGALAKWQQAGAFYDRRPDPFYNTGVVLSQRGDVQGSVASFRQALAALDKLPADTSATEMQSRLETRAVALSGMLNGGARLFSQDQLAPAEAIFREVVALDSTNRDARYNHALSLYKLERWTELEPVAAGLLRVDPLNENAHVLLYNAFKFQSDAARTAGDTARSQQIARRAITVAEAQQNVPVFVDGVNLTNAEGSTALTGQVAGNAAAAGTPVRIEFTLYGVGGGRFTHTVTVQAPAKGQTAQFEAAVPATEAVTSFSYRLLPG